MRIHNQHNTPIMIKYTDLRVSNVKFHEGSHTYWSPSGMELVGTSKLLKMLFPNKYRGVPKDVLERAAERGSAIHQACQDSDIWGEIYEGCPYSEVYKYRSLLDDSGIKMIAAEYLVSDEMQIATMIDCIDDQCNLYDIKTTSIFDHEAVSWQLSICAYLFEQQNPHLKAGKLYGIHLRGSEGGIIEVDRKADEDILGLLVAHASGNKLYLPQEIKQPMDGDFEVALVENIEREIIEFKTMIDTLEERKREALENVKAQMIERGIKKVETERILLTIVEDSKTTTLDSKALKADHPEIAQRYTKESIRKGYVKITLR